mgnify:CR=1 FL=1
MQQYPIPGRIRWIGVRPARRESIVVAEEAFLRAGVGITGDRYASKGGKRQVTMIQSEHIQAIAAFVSKDCLDPALLRRNIVVAGINLLSLKGQRFSVGSAVLEFTGLCHPCSRMEEVLGEGGYNAMRGHGGITAKIIESGVIRMDDKVSPCP